METSINLFWPVAIFLLSSIIIGIVAGVVVYNIRKWAQTANNNTNRIADTADNIANKLSKNLTEILAINLSKDPKDFEDNIAKIENAFHSLANYLGRKEADENIFKGFSEKLDRVIELQTSKK